MPSLSYISLIDARSPLKTEMHTVKQQEVDLILISSMV